MIDFCFVLALLDAITTKQEVNLIFGFFLTPNPTQLPANIKLCVARFRTHKTVFPSINSWVLFGAQKCRTFKTHLHYNE